jgi:hypothetical protein
VVADELVDPEDPLGVVLAPAVVARAGTDERPATPPAVTNAIFENFRNTILPRCL